MCTPGGWGYFDGAEPSRQRGGADGGRHVHLVGVRTALDRDGHLMQVVAARHACGGLAHFLDCGQEQADENGDDGDHHQQLDQREAAAASQDSEERHTTPP